MEPLAGFVLDAGLSVQDFTSIFREAAVRSIAARQLEAKRKINISGIAASTGITRTEISRILKSVSKSPDQKLQLRQQSTNRILAAWHQDPRFTTPNGQPAELKIYGRGATFEALVKSNARGLPIRALLDELIRVDAIEVRPAQVVRVKTFFAVDRGVTPDIVQSFGDRATELLSTMLQNMRHPEGSAFIANISAARIPNSLIPLFRKQLNSKGADFLAEMQDILVRAPSEVKKIKRSEKLRRLSVTIFSHESPLPSAMPTLTKRRNFRRGM
jgi:hypothetical protein